MCNALHLHSRSDVMNGVLMPPDKSVSLIIIVLISQPKRMLWVLKKETSPRCSLEHLNTCLNVFSGPMILKLLPRVWNSFKLSNWNNDVPQVFMII